MVNLRFPALMMTALLWAIAVPSVRAQSRPPVLPADQLQTRLDRAVCLNDWGQAITLISQLIASSDIPPSYRSQLVDYRYQLQSWQAVNLTGQQITGCDLVLANPPAETLVPISPALDLVQRDTRNRRDFNWGAEVSAMMQRLEADPVASAPAVLSGELSPLLAAATPIALRNGTGRVNDSVSSGHDLFRFAATAGDRVDIQVEMPPSTLGYFGGGDSQLFLFNATGELLAENDDYNGLGSALMGITIPETGSYFIAVTTFNNDPQFDQNGYLSGWPDNGSGNITYTLTVQGASNSVASQ